MYIIQWRNTVTGQWENYTERSSRKMAFKKCAVLVSDPKSVCEWRIVEKRLSGWRTIDKWKWKRYNPPLRVIAELSKTKIDINNRYQHHKE